MKAVPAKVLALGLAIVACLALYFLESRPKPVAAESLHVTTEAIRNASGQIQLDVSWHWDPHVGRLGWRNQEELLAVSFDQRSLVFLGEQAPSGVGANGHTLRQLEQVAGPDGSRRLFVIPRGEAGHVTLQFGPRFPGQEPEGDPFRLYVAFDSPAQSVVMSETALPSATGQMARY